MRVLYLSLFALGLFGATALAQMSHSSHEHGTRSVDGILQMPGQDMFGAISEIVNLLENEPDTDWSQVDITALREHLLDMDRLMTSADVVSNPVPGGIEMTISKTGPGGQSVERMVTAHGPVLMAETGWSSELEPGEGVLVWRVSSEHAADTMKIRALGFFGLMATGAHHQEHHLAIAKAKHVH